MRHATHRHSLGAITYGFEIRWRSTAQPLGKKLARKTLDQPNAVQVFFQQAPVTGLIWRANSEFLREAPSAENCGIDALKVVRGPDQEHIVLRFKFTDQSTGLLDELNVVLRLNAGISRKEAVHFVDEDNGRVILFGPGEQIGELLHRRPGGSSENIGGRNWIEAPLGLSRNQAGDRRLARARWA